MCIRDRHIEDKLLVSEVAKRRETQAEKRAEQTERDRRIAERTANMTQGGATESPSSDNGIPMPPEDVMLAPEVDGDGNYLNCLLYTSRTFKKPDGQEGTG